MEQIDACHVVSNNSSVSCNYPWADAKSGGILLGNPMWITCHWPLRLAQRSRQSFFSNSPVPGPAGEDVDIIFNSIFPRSVHGSGNVCSDAARSPSPPTKWLVMFGGSNTESALEKRQNGTAPDANSALNALDHEGNHVPATSGATLLPRPVASLVSFFAHSTSLSFRIGAFFGGAAIDGVRVTTLTGLELSRAVIEGVLTRAERDVTIRSSERGKAEAESLLERSVSS